MAVTTLSITTLTDRFSKDLERGFEDSTQGYRRGDIIKYVINVPDADMVGIGGGSGTGAGSGTAGTAVATDATGVNIGDVVVGAAANGLAADPIHTAGVSVTADVTDEDEITVTVNNNSASTADPGLQTFTVLVMKIA